MGEKDYYPPMHSAEHILNQTMVRMYNCGRSVTNHLEKKKSKCDYIFDRELSDVEIRRIEAEVNKVIESHLLVSEEMVTLKEASEKYNLSKLPVEVGETIRIVKIGGYDACPCIGQHVENTSEIGKFQIISSGFEEGKLRVRFKLIENEYNK